MPPVGNASVGVTSVAANGDDEPRPEPPADGPADGSADERPDEPAQQPDPLGHRALEVLGAVIALAIVAFVGWRLLAPRGEAPVDSPAAVQSHGAAPAPASALEVATGHLASWLRTDVDPAARVVVSRPVQRLLIGDPGGPPPQPLTRSDQVSGAGYDLVVVAGGDPVSAADRLAESGVPVTRFGSLEVRQVGPTAATAKDTRAQQQRAAAGRDLLANKELTFISGADERLAGGEVDPRLMALLATVAAQHSAVVRLRCDEVDVSGTPHCRAAELTAIDGRAVMSPDGLPAALRTIVDQTLPSRASNPAGVFVRTANPPYVRFTFLVPVPAGLLGDAAFPTAH